MPTVVEPLSYSALDYLKSFGVVAVCVSPSGRVFVSRDPKGAAAAWWTKSEHADQIAHVHGPMPTFPAQRHGWGYRSHPTTSCVDALANGRLRSTKPLPRRSTPEC